MAVSLVNWLVGWLHGDVSLVTLSPFNLGSPSSEEGISNSVTKQSVLCIL